MRAEDLDSFDRLLTIMDDLREKCPWDREQTIDTLRKLTIEETYELVDAIDSGDWFQLKGELGDLFLHLVFYSKIASENNHFTVSDVLNEICEKLIHRHPHVYAHAEADSSAKVKENWEAIKIKEKGGKEKSVLEGVPKSLPALVKAYRIQEKVQGVGFDWPDAESVWAKVEEELKELRNPSSRENELMELGDVMFSLVNYAKHRGLDPEQALSLSNAKFLKRFQKMEEMLAKKKKSPIGVKIEEWNDLWNKAKKIYS